MNTIEHAWTRLNDFFKSLADTYYKGYAAEMKNLPLSESKTGHRGVFLP